MTCIATLLACPKEVLYAQAGGEAPQPPRPNPPPSPPAETRVIFPTCAVPTDRGNNDVKWGGTVVKMSRLREGKLVKVDGKGWKGAILYLPTKGQMAYHRLFSREPIRVGKNCWVGVCANDIAIRSGFDRELGTYLEVTWDMEGQQRTRLYRAACSVQEGWATYKLKLPHGDRWDTKIGDVPFFGPVEIGFKPVPGGTLVRLKFEGLALLTHNPENFLAPLAR